MGVKVGIVGLPNVGKSTTFNALTKTQNAQCANYPFCTIEPNKAVVNVPDERVKKIAQIVKPQRVIYSTIEFVDIAGLVKGASKGEGLGNQFLGNIREVDMILHIVRCFEDENVTHVEGNINPLRDIEIIESELIFADLQQNERKIERLRKSVKADKKLGKFLDKAIEIKEHLEQLKPIRTFGNKDEIFESLNKELRFLSAKSVIFGANVSEEFLTQKNNYVEKIKGYAKDIGAEVIKICAKIEEELVGLDEEEANELLKELGVEESGLNKIIKLSFKKLNLISFFTAGKKEVKSWTIPKNTKAPQAAGEIHSDFERGFIKAEVISYNDFITFESETKAKEAGKIRIEGKEYVVKDGDVIYFRFNV